MNTYYIAGFPVADELYHHGIKGQKWGVRRYQNEDGTLTADGKIRYGGNARNIQRDLNRLDKEKAYTIGDIDTATRKLGKETRKIDKYKDIKSEEWKQRHQAKADSAAKDKDEYEKRYAELDADTKRLVQKAIDQGMDVKVTRISRTTQRAGEYYTRHALAHVMAYSMAMVLPIGIGLAKDESVDGYQYRVKKPKNK